MIKRRNLARDPRYDLHVPGFLFFFIFSNHLSLRSFLLRMLEGSRDGAVVRALASHQCGPGSIPGLGVICGLSLLLVLVLAPRGFSPGTPVFPSPQKPTFLNSNSIWKVSPISAVRAKYI